MPWFLQVVLSERSFDLSTGQGERANVERPFVVRRLQDTIGTGNVKLGGNNNERLILFISFDAC